MKSNILKLQHHFNLKKNNNFFYKMDLLLEESEIYKNLDHEENTNEESYELLLSPFSDEEKDLISIFYKSKEERNYSFSVDELLSLLRIFDYLGVKAAYEIALFLYFFEKSKELRKNPLLANYNRNIYKNEGRYRIKQLYFLERGMIHPIKWLMEKDLFYVSDQSEDDVTISEKEFFTALGRCNNIDMYEFLFKKEFLYNNDINRCLESREHDTDFFILEYLYSKKEQDIDIDELFYVQCENGNLVFIKWISSKNQISIKRGFRYSCRKKQFELMKYFLHNFKLNIEDKVDGFTMSCEEGDFKISKYLYEYVKNDLEDTEHLFYIILDSEDDEMIEYFKNKFQLTDEQVAISKRKTILDNFYVLLANEEKDDALLYSQKFNLTKEEIIHTFDELTDEYSELIVDNFRELLEI